MSQPVVTIISLGGTIASVPDETGLAGPRLSAADLVSVLPQLGEIAQIEVRDLARLPSCDVTFRLGRDVATEIAEAVARGSTGIVVTQGTDTIEELSFCLDLLVRTDTPLAVVGAMRHAGLPGADGAANLLDAVRTVLSPAAVRARLRRRDERADPLGSRRPEAAHVHAFCVQLRRGWTPRLDRRGDGTPSGPALPADHAFRARA